MYGFFPLSSNLPPRLLSRGSACSAPRNGKKMVRPSMLLHYTRRRFTHPSARGFSFFLVPSTLALVTSLLILFYVFTTSTLFSHHHHRHRHPDRLRIQRPRVDLRSQINFASPLSNQSVSAPPRAAREAESRSQRAGNGHPGTYGE